MGPLVSGAWCFGADSNRVEDSVNGHASNGSRARQSRQVDSSRLSWWRELAMVVVFYGVYSLVRDAHGSSQRVAVSAFHNAQGIIAVERWLGIFDEQRLQHLFLRWNLVIEVLNDVYNTTHFVVPVVLLVVLYRGVPREYRLWRNALAITTGLALVGFTVFPVMPPRLLPAGYHFVDTLKTVGGLWSFDSGPVSKVSNQFAAMPSLHMAWSTWCAAVMVVTVRRRWAKAAAVAYPVLTLFCIVVTANHYFLDAVAGVITVGVGVVIAFGVRSLADAARDADPSVRLDPLPDEPGTMVNVCQPYRAAGETESTRRKQAQP